MPNCQEHCADSQKKYNYDFEELHIWMDEPSRIAGGKHGSFRHELFKTPEEAEKIFWEKTPERFRPYIKNAVLDHIMLDSLDSSGKQDLNVFNYSMREFGKLTMYIESIILGFSKGKDTSDIDLPPDVIIEECKKNGIQAHTIISDGKLIVDYIYGYCPDCGKKILNNARFCNKCGKRF